MNPESVLSYITIVQKTNKLIKECDYGKKISNN